MNRVMIAYHSFKKVQQKYNLKETDLLTVAENDEVNQELDAACLAKKF